MQDIDFEELDRAVNSVLGSSPSGIGPASDPVEKEKVTEIPTTLPANDAAPSPAARRSSGRFMDFVHSSSDMRANTAAPAATAPEPTPAPAPLVPPAPVVAEVSEEPEEPVAPQDTFTWPDPIDMPGTHSIQSAEEVPEFEEPIAEEPVQVDAPIEEQSASDTPLESPFLSDAKIEKRPLGAFSAEAAAAPLAFPTDPVVEAAPIVEEIATVATEAVVETPIIEAQSEAIIETPIEAPVEEPAPAPVVTATPEAAPVGPISISQQYQEQPSTTDQPSGAIYDTEAYHQPLAHPIKKSSGLWVVLWILGLIILGGGVGAAIYFFVLA